MIKTKVTATVIPNVKVTQGHLYCSKYKRRLWPLWKLINIQTLAEKDILVHKHISRSISITDTS